MENYKNKFDLEGKKCFVLGGSGLLGLEICKAFLDFGAKVVCLDVDLKNAQSLLDNKDYSKNLILEEFDCTSIDNLEKELLSLFDSYSCPDVFVNSSYPRTPDWTDSSFNKVKLKSLEDNIKLNLVSTSWISRFIAESMKSQSICGSIIHLGSIYGVVGQNMNVYKGTEMTENMIYSIIKGGIINLTRQMASSYGSSNIRINCISPGGVEGPVAGKESGQDNLFIQNYSMNNPIKRLARPEEIGASAVFLASEASSYITGINLVIDGGWTAI